LALHYSNEYRWALKVIIILKLFCSSV